MTGSPAPHDHSDTFAAYCDGRLDADALAEFEALLHREPQVLAAFADYCEVHAQLAWRYQAQHAAQAATPTSTRKSRPWVWPLAAMIVLGVSVAMSVLLAYAWERHQRLTTPRTPFATLINTRDAVFEPSDLPTTPGSPLPGGFLRLASGEVDIEFFSGASVTLTGPCTFGVNSAMRGYLEHGRVHVFCPPAAKGFTIGAPGVAVVDLGTRFDLIVTDGRTDLRVLEGEVELATLDASGVANRVERLTQHTTARVTNGEIERNALPLDDRAGPLRLSLAHIVGTGDGDASKPLPRLRGIDPVTGYVVDQPHAYGVGRSGDGFSPVNELPMVDGVFVPDGGNGPVQIDSTGRTYDGFPDTRGLAFGFLWPGPEWRGYDTMLGGIDYASPGHMILGMHTSKAITFDLDAIRRAYPGRRITRFTAVAANVTTRFNGHAVDLRVLVDGQARFVRPWLLRAKGPQTIDVAITATDRFLTIASSEATFGQPTWMILGDPQLELVPNVFTDGGDGPRGN